jgi:hypothetical protein
VRLYGETIVLVIAGSLLAWVHRAPEDPAGRAAYLCRPVATIGSAISGLSRIAFEGGGSPAFARPWNTDLRQECTRFIEEIATREGE